MYYVIDQMPDPDGEPVIYGEGLSLREAKRMVREIEGEDDGRIPLIYDYLP